MKFEANKALDKYYDGANLVLAGLLFVTPWVFRFTDRAIAPWHAWAGAIVVAVLAIAALTKFAEWEEWLEAIAGVWLVIAPWALGFSAIALAMWSHVVVGVLVAALATFRGWRAHTHATA